VVMVHGYMQPPSVFDAMKASFENLGYQAYEVDIPGDDNYANAAYIETFVNNVQAQTGAAKVNLVGHSMGGLSARYYIKYRGGDAHVASYISVGTPQYGGPDGCLLPTNLGGQMCPNSPFLVELNTGDDTSGTLPYTDLWGTAQDDPATAAKLDGGACFKSFDGVQHLDEPSSPVVFQLVATAVRGTCPGTFETQPIT
jgi:triacylglycerol lipase